MIDRVGNLWTEPADFRVITTNGSVRKDGRAVMGRGCAHEAAQQFPHLPTMLGARLTLNGNRIHYFSDVALGADFGLFTFPVKHQWMEPASLELIAESVASFSRQLLTSATYVMPRPGCGNGRLRWTDVQPLLAPLPDSVIVVHFEDD